MFRRLKSDELFDVISRPALRRSFEALDLASPTSWYEIRRRLHRDRLEDVERVFAKLLNDSPLERTMAAIRGATQAVYLTWMAHPWGPAKRHRRAEHTVAYLNADALERMIQHPTWLEALSRPGISTFHRCSATTASNIDVVDSPQGSTTVE